MLLQRVGALQGPWRILPPPHRPFTHHARHVASSYPRPRRTQQQTSASASRTQTPEGLRLRTWTGSATEVQVRRGAARGSSDGRARPTLEHTAACTGQGTKLRHMGRQRSRSGGGPAPAGFLWAGRRCLGGSLIRDRLAPGLPPPLPQALDALRRRLAADPYELPPEETLRWFLLDRGLDVGEAHDKLRAMLRWRREFGCARACSALCGGLPVRGWGVGTGGVQEELHSCRVWLERRLRWAVEGARGHAPCCESPGREPACKDGKRGLSGLSCAASQRSFSPPCAPPLPFRPSLRPGLTTSASQT